MDAPEVAKWILVLLIVALCVALLYEPTEPAAACCAPGAQRV